jgi:hypothetical protein
MDAWLVVEWLILICRFPVEQVVVGRASGGVVSDGIRHDQHMHNNKCVQCIYLGADSISTLPCL